jgi:hypothetical protein
VSAELFSVTVGIGAAALALWIDARWPALAPESLGLRFLSLGAAVALLQLGVLGFEHALALTLDAHVRALVALGVLVTAMTFAFVTAVWLLRSLQGLSATR